MFKFVAPAQQTSLSKEWALIKGKRSTPCRCSLRSSWSGEKATLPCQTRIPPCNMQRGQVPGHFWSRVLLVALLKAWEQQWMLTVGAADFRRAAWIGVLKAGATDSLWAIAEHTNGWRNRDWRPVRSQGYQRQAGRSRGQRQADQARPSQARPGRPRRQEQTRRRADGPIPLPPGPRRLMSQLSPLGCCSDTTVCGPPRRSRA